MAKITRATHKIFGAAGASTYFGEFGSAKLGPTGVTTKDLATIMSLGAWGNGWQDALVATANGNAPCLEEENAVMFVHSTQMGYIFQEGISEWDVGTTYYQYSIVKLAGTGQLHMCVNPSPTGIVGGGYAPSNGASNSNWTWTNPPGVKDGGLTTGVLPKVSAAAVSGVPAILAPSAVSEDSSNVILAKPLKFPGGTVQSVAAQAPVSHQTDCLHPAVSRVKNNTYQNLNGAPLFVCVSLSQSAVAGSAHSYAYCDASATPTTVVCDFVTSCSSSDVSVGARVPLFFIVLPNYYYKITGSGTVTAWIEWY